MIAEPRSFRVSEGATRRPVTGRGEQAEGREPWLPHIFMHAPCQMPEMARRGGMLPNPAATGLGAITHLHNFFTQAMRKDADVGAAGIIHDRNGFRSGNRRSPGWRQSRQMPMPWASRRPLPLRAIKGKGLLSDQRDKGSGIRRTLCRRCSGRSGRTRTGDP